MALLTTHHIVSDGWSMGVLLGELGALYSAYEAGGESPLQELPVQYADYAVWQRRWLEGEVLEGQLSYWRERLAGVEPLELTADRPRPAAQSHRGAHVSFDLSPELSAGLAALARQEGATLFMVMLAGFAALLYRVSGTWDVAVGTPIAGRVRRELEGLIGFFVNTLVVRVRGGAGLSFRGLIGEAREACVGAYAHQDVPFEKLVEELQPERDLSRPPLFQVWFALHQAAIQGSLELPGVQLTPLETEAPFAKVDLALIMNERPEGLVGRFWYDAELFEPETINQLVTSFVRLLAAVVGRPEQTVIDIPLAEQPEEVAAAGAAGAVDEFVF